MNILRLSLILLVALSTSASATVYTCSAINPLPGRDFSEAVSINSHGVVLVSSGLRSVDPRGAFTWNPDSGVGEVFATGTIDRPYAISDVGQIAGSYSDGHYWNGAVRSTDGTVTRLTSIQPDVDSAAVSIDSYGQAVGYSGAYAVLWQANGNINIISGSDTSPAKARAISDNGVVVYTQDSITGGSVQYTKSFVWNPNGTSQQLEDLTALDGVTSAGYAVNDLGQVAGTSAGHAVLWNSDGTIAADFGIGEAYGINNLGQVVGTQNGCAVMWDTDGSVLTLPNLIGGPGNSWAVSINDNGQIAGSIISNEPGDYLYTAVLWEPIPEPSAFAALACGLVGIGIRRRFFG